MTNHRHGVCVTTHVASGKVYIALTQHLTSQASQEQYRLRSGEHSNKELQRLYDADARLTHDLHPAANRRIAIDHWCRLVADYRPQGLLLNNRVQPTLDKYQAELIPHVGYTQPQPHAHG